MSVSIRPNHTAIGVPQWRHTPAHTTLGQPLPDMTGLTLSDGTDYDLVLPDSVWRTIYEDLQEHFAKVDGKTTIPVPMSCPECGSYAAWHGVIVEADQPPRSACDECGHVEVLGVAS